MKNTIKIFVTLFISATLLNSCVVDDSVDVKYNQSDYVIGFKSDLAAESFFEDIGPVQKSYPIDVLGGQDNRLLEEPITVNFEIDPASTATQGQEFNFLTEGTSLTIPAGSDFVGFPLEILTGGLNPDEPTVLILKLTSTNSEGSVISSLNNTLQITFVGCQSTVDLYDYQVTTVRQSDNALVKFGVESLEQLEVNFFRTESTGPYGPDSAGGPIASQNGFTFTDICGDITVSKQGLANGTYSNQVYGSGSVDPETGNIQITVTIEFPSGNQTYIHTYEKL
ncbi:hypothetical protein [Psychroflexus sp. MBR-150]|jgi:hypothetical protein